LLIPSLRSAFSFAPPIASLHAVRGVLSTAAPAANAEISPHKPVSTSLFTAAAATGSKAISDTANLFAAGTAALAIPCYSNASLPIISVFPMLLLIAQLINQINLACLQI
jgi:hypothetical protein